jgi:CHAT domain-containing protein
VVCSYTPTLSALINAQADRGKPDSRCQPEIVIVSQPEAAGLPPLPNAWTELDRIRELVPPAGLTVFSGDGGTIETVMTGLSDASVLHLACHGHQSQDDPLSSGFSLHNGRLTLKQLMGLHLPNAQFAYLSACETASTDEYQPDEAINLAATMLFVGFKSVIATMWYVSSSTGPEDWN